MFLKTSAFEGPLLLIQARGFLFPLSAELMTVADGTSQGPFFYSVNSFSLDLLLGDVRPETGGCAAAGAWPDAIGRLSGHNCS